MVLPPNRLNTIVRIDSADKTYSALKKRGYLKDDSAATRREIFAVVAAYQVSPSGEDGRIIVGPSRTDQLAGALMPFLSKRGVKAYHQSPEPEDSPLRGWWRRVLEVIRNR